MVAFHRSIPGRLMALALALPLSAGAIFPWDGHFVKFLGLAIVGGLALTFVAAALAIEDYPAKAFNAMLFVPLAVFSYLPLVAIVVPRAHDVIYPIAATACLLLAMAVRPGLPARPGMRLQRQRTTG